MITLALADRDPTGRDSRLIWTWRNDPLTRMMSRTTEEVPWESHLAWIAHTPATLLIASADGEPAAMLRFDGDEISINLDPAVRGRSLGEPILRAGCDYGFTTLGLDHIKAIVKSDNIASNKIFIRVGFMLESEQDGLRAYLRKRG